VRPGLGSNGRAEFDAERPNTVERVLGCDLDTKRDAGTHSNGCS
jgi:hypothetical protein